MEKPSNKNSNGKAFKYKPQLKNLKTEKRDGNTYVDNFFMDKFPRKNSEEIYQWC